MDGMKYYKMGLIYDCICILVAAAVLYVANKHLLPTWALIVLTLFALVPLIMSIYCMVKARKAFKREAEIMPKVNDESEETEAEPTQETDEEQ